MTSPKELQQYEKNLKKYEEELLNAQKDINQQKTEISQYANQMYGSGDKQNLVEWELNFKSELDDIARSLRCDVLVIDNKGNQYWKKNPSPDKVFLNELGVNDILRKVILLVNKNKILSNYTMEEIQKRVNMIGHEIRTLIYTNYEAYGIDNGYKMNNYSSIVMDIVSIIDDAYRRALGGEAHRGLSEQRVVTQSDNLNATQKPQYNMQHSTKWYNPSTWGAR